MKTNASCKSLLKYRRVFHDLYFIFNFVSFRLDSQSMPKPGFYAVRAGRAPGVYCTWAECEAQIKGYPNAIYKKFPTEGLANEFIDSQLKINLTGESKNRWVESEKRNINLNHDSSKSNIISNLNYFEPAPYVIKSERDLISVPTVIRNHNDLHQSAPSIITSASESTSVPSELIYPGISKRSYYAVHRGRQPGVYRSWTECSAQVKDMQNASYRKFESEEEALEYVRTGGIANKTSRREMRNLKYDNHVVKKRKLTEDGNEDEYVLVDPDKTVVVFTDGASAENGKKRARAGFGVYWGPNHPLNTSKRLSGRQTNNRAEIHAAIHALNQAKQIGAKKVKLYTDSQFMIHAVTDWIKKWQDNKWRLVTGETVVNKDDFLELIAAQKGLEVVWIYVKAHAGNHGNVQADRLAVAGTKFLMEPPKCANPQMSDDTSSVSENKSFILASASTSGEILPIVPSEPEKKPFYAVHRGEIPGVYLTWRECEKQIKHFPNPRFRKFFSEEEAVEFVKSGQFHKEFKIPECDPDEYVVVFTDGASSSNGKEGARAGIGVYWGPGNPLNTSMRLPGRQTNNRAEIFAAVHALRQAKQLGIKNVRLYTDSKFVINGINTWIHKWKKNEWKLANGNHVINKEDFIALDDACQGLNHIDWCYVKGHSNNPGNVEADKLAVSGCSKSLSETIVLT